MIKRIARWLGYVKVGYPHFGVDITITYRDHYDRERAQSIHLEPGSSWGGGSRTRRPITNHDPLRVFQTTLTLQHRRIRSCSRDFYSP